jgi:hypothetical protein
MIKEHIQKTWEELPRRDSGTLRLVQAKSRITRASIELKCTPTGAKPEDGPQPYRREQVRGKSSCPVRQYADGLAFIIEGNAVNHQANFTTGSSEPFAKDQHD